MLWSFQKPGKLVKGAPKDREGSLIFKKCLPVRWRMFTALSHPQYHRIFHIHHHSLIQSANPPRRFNSATFATYNDGTVDVIGAGDNGKVSLNQMPHSNLKTKGVGYFQSSNFPCMCNC